MGGGLRALTRVRKPKKTWKQPGDRSASHGVVEQETPKPTPLQLVTFTEEQEQSQATKVVKRLPTSTKELSKALKGAGKDPIERSLVIQRLRDFFNPILPENVALGEDYKKFILSMLFAWLESPDAPFLQ